MKCPSCSGTLYYDIRLKKLKCRHCSSVFEVDEYESDNKAIESELSDAKLFTCRNCGAELISTNDEAVSYCSYCGSEAVLESRLSDFRKPKYIVPFKIDKSECKKIYEKALGDKLYVPKEFKDPEFIDRFRPFYIPYWMYQIRFRDDNFDLKGTKSYTSHGYDYYEEYDVKAAIRDKGIYGVPYDASRNFDDSIAENIAPFNKKDMVAYKNGYLAGMYADSPNVAAEVYKEDVLQRATDMARNDLEQSFSGIYLELPRKKKLQEFLQTRYDGEDALFLPVWFLTWKKGDRVAYAVVNGQTGKIHIDLPADISQFGLYTFGLAALIFVILTLFVSVTSRFVIWFAALLVYLVSIRYHVEMKQIRDRENHVFDKGYLITDEDELSMSEKKRARIRNKTRVFAGFSSVFLVGLAIFVMVFAFMMTGALYDELVSQTGAIAITFIVLILQTIRFFKTMIVMRHVSNKRSLLPPLLAIGAVAYAFAVASAEPVQDWWYYLGALIALLAASLMALDLIARYNETSTRPLPSFYNRKGGNDSATES